MTLGPRHPGEQRAAGAEGNVRPGEADAGRVEHDVEHAPRRRPLARRELDERPGTDRATQAAPGAGRQLARGEPVHGDEPIPRRKPPGETAQDELAGRGGADRTGGR